MPVSWPDHVDEILGGDAAAGFVYLTPAKGAVISPMAPLGQRDREAGTVTVSTSQGLWKKLERVRADPSVALAFHAREHGFSERSEFVLVQGTASFPIEPSRRWLEEVEPAWERFLGPKSGGLTGRLLDVYYNQRVPITIDVKRILVWPDEACTGEPDVHGEPLPGPAPPQSAPKQGTGPRVDVERTRSGIERLPHSLLAWRGADGLPLAVSVGAKAADAAGVSLDAPAIVPEGGRRAGITSHRFERHMVGQEQLIQTGWLDVDSGGRAVYAPHTKAGYKLPASKALFTVGSIVATRAGIRKARERGLAPSR